MRQFIIILILFLTTSSIASAQKKEIAQAKTYLKSGKDFDKAETLLRKVLAMPGEEENIDVYYLLTEAVRRQYEQKNEQLYLRTLKDTASLFPLARRMFSVYTSLDSLDSRPDKKNQVKTRYRKRNGDYLNRFRKNLLSGGVFSMKKQNYREAYDCMDTYLECENQPLFAGRNYSSTDTMRFEAAYVALMAARNLKRHDLMLKHRGLAERHPQNAHLVLVQLHQSFQENGDTLSAVRCLEEGFKRFPKYSYFFPRLVDYYISSGDIDRASGIVDKALAIDEENLFYRMARNTILLNTGKYDDCIHTGNQLIKEDETMETAYYNVGSAYYNKAVERDRQGLASKKKRNEVNELYRQALPYIEKYRTMRPNRQDQWAKMLYTIYLNLNMGKEFDEINNLMK